VETIKKSTLQKFKTLEKIISSYPSALLAYSGGVDSSFLLFVMNKILKERFIAVTAVSPTFPPFDLERAKTIVKFFNVKHIIVQTKELENDDFCKNSPQRCYYCKMELFTICKEIAQKHGIKVICEGSNLDDLNDYRPGRRAGEELGVKSPLVESGLKKHEIKLLSQFFDIPYWDSPPSPCLASRFPYGIIINEERLNRVMKAEEFLKNRGFKVVRARFQDDKTLRIEVDEKEIERIVNSELRKELLQFMKKIGFDYILLDMEGYVQGKLNRMLK